MFELFVVVLAILAGIAGALLGMING